MYYKTLYDNENGNFYHHCGLKQRTDNDNKKTSSPVSADKF